MAEIICPRCGFSKEVDIETLPANVNRVNCPRCQENFPLPQRQAGAAAAPGPTETRQREQSVPAIGERQEIDPKTLPKAGFWIRFVAFSIDEILVSILFSIFGGLLFLAGSASGLASSDGNGSLALLIQIFWQLLNIVYYVFFTGYCGQTPGKMALRIKVIRCDGTPLSYPRAAFREIPAKFISGIIFCIGYLMAAFDQQKQSLHDRMAGTYVIKL